MDNQYFKALEKYNKSDKLTDQNVINRLEQKLKQNNISFNFIKNYVICNGEFLVMIDAPTNFFGTFIPHIEKLETVRL